MQAQYYKDRQTQDVKHIRDTQASKFSSILSLGDPVTGLNPILIDLNNANSAALNPQFQRNMPYLAFKQKLTFSGRLFFLKRLSKSKPVQLVVHIASYSGTQVHFFLNKIIHIMDYEYSAININMPRVKLSSLEKNAYIYEIDVATRWGKWHIEKKFADFQDLHSSISQQFDSLPEFPTNYLSFFMSTTEEEANDNKDILEEYLRVTSRRRDIVNTSVYTQFLQLDKHSPQMLANKPKLVKEFTMEERINDSGKVILDFYVSDDFIVFSTGNDNPVEKFNSLVANSKFPWEQEEEIEFVLPLGTVQCWLKKKEDGSYKRVWARNYPVETRRLIFSPSSLCMVVGLADGGVEVFRLFHKPRYIYYEVIKLLEIHEEEIKGIYLDELNMIIYSASADGWINMIEAKRGVKIDQMETSSGIVSMLGDSTNLRLFVALEEGNIEIYEYTTVAKLRCMHILTLPDCGELRTLLFDSHRNYLFTGAYQSGEVYIFQIGKRGHEKISKQIGRIQSKEKIVDMVWNPDKMELLVSSLSGQIFFWDTIKSRQIYMLKAFDDLQLSKTAYLKDKGIIMTTSRGRCAKFWEIPKSWRDAKCENDEENQLDIRRKVDNLYKTREALKRKMNDSDEDDLKGWHWEDSQEEEDK